MIICGLQDSQPRDVDAQSPSCNSDTRQDPVKKTRMSPWRVPRLFPFNYTMSPPRARSNAQRRSIPFEDTVVHHAPARVESPETTDDRATILAHIAQANNDKSVPLVSLHPPHPRWTDESDPDHPYDNPYYSRPIRNSLWLPRNPYGLLDLDDTIDLSEALTSSENSGDLRSWIVGSRSPPSGFKSPLLEHSPGNMARVSPGTLAATTPPCYSGNEEIVFSPHSTTGVHDSNDHEVSQLEHHSSIYRLHNRSQTTPTAARWPPIDSFHSEGRPVFDPSTRSPSLPIIGRSPSSTSRDLELAEVAGRLPGASVNASVELLASSLRRPGVHMAESSTATLAEAAVAEERRVMDECMRREEAEAEDHVSTRKRPWWMGFFLSRAAT
jgi:hypothetical protein